MLVLKKIKPLMDGVVTTGNRYNEVYSAGGILDPTKSGEFKEYQTVLFVSDSCEGRGIKVGDTVMVNFYNYARPVQKLDTMSVKNDIDEYFNAGIAFHIPAIDIDGKECLDLRASDIKYVILEMVDKDSKKSKLVKKPELVKGIDLKVHRLNSL